MKHSKRQRRLTMREFLTRHPTLRFKAGTAMEFMLPCTRTEPGHENCKASHPECIQLAPEDLPELIEIVRAGLTVKPAKSRLAKPRKSATKVRRGT